MRLIRDLAKHLLSIEPVEGDRKKTYNAFDYLDKNIIDLFNRIEALEKRNLKYYVRATHDADQTSTTGVALTLDFNTTAYPQLGSMHDDSINNENFYIRRTGVYDIKAAAESTLASASSRSFGILLNRDGSSYYLDLNTITVTGLLIQRASASAYLYEDDYIQLIYLQSSGGNVDVKARTEYSPIISVVERMEDLDPSEYGLMLPEEHFR